MVTEYKQPQLGVLDWYKYFPLVQAATKDAGLQILLRAKLDSWQAGVQIIGQSENSDAVYFLISGTCRAIFFSAQGTEIGFRKIAHGHHFGELGVLTNRRRLTSVIAETDCVTAKLTSADFRALLLVEPGIAVNISSNLAESIQSLTSRVIEFSTLSVKQRIWAEILRLCRDRPKTSDQTIQMPMLSHDRLASSIGVNREAVTRELSAMREAGIIDYNRKQLRILQLDALQNNEQLAELFDFTILNF